MGPVRASATAAMCLLSCRAGAEVAQKQACTPIDVYNLVSVALEVETKDAQASTFSLSGRTGVAFVTRNAGAAAVNFQTGEGTFLIAGDLVSAATVFQPGADTVAAPLYQIGVHKDGKPDAPADAPGQSATHAAPAAANAGGSTSGPTTVPAEVPSPSAGALLAAAGFALGTRRRRRRQSDTVG